MRRSSQASHHLILFLLLTSVVTFVGVGHTSHAQEVSEVTLQVNPATVRVSPDTKARLIVLLNNGSEDTLREVTIVPVLPTGLVMNLTGNLPERVPPNASLTASFQLLRSSGSVPATGLLRAHFRRPSSDGTFISQTVVQAFEIKSQEAEPIDQIAKVELKAPGAVLDEFGGTDLAVVVTNTSASAITITKIEPTAPEPIQFTSDAGTNEITLPPGHQQALRFHMSVAGGTQVRSGENMVLVQVEVAWGADDNRRTASLVATQTVKLGVFAESDIAELAKIPSLLFLPGFMLLMAIVLLVKLPQIQLAKMGDAISTSPTVFAFLMVPASLVTLGAYWLLTRRDLRFGYNFNDVVYVSVLGILLAGAIVLVVQIVKLRWIAWNRVSLKDEPIAVLRKLGRQRMGLRLKRVLIKGSNNNVGLLYEDSREGSKTAVIGPWICLEYKSRSAGLQKAINDYRTDGRDPGGLAKLLRKATDQQVHARWKPADNSNITQIMALDKDRIEVTGPESDFVEEC